MRLSYPELRALLDRIDYHGCDCPLLLSCPCGQECPEGVREHCRCCRDECNCPPADYQPACRHVLVELDPADEYALICWYDRVCAGSLARSPDEMIAALRRVLNPEDYADPPPPLPDSTHWSDDARVNLLAERARKGRHLYHPLDRYRRKQSQVARMAQRARNGSVFETELRRG